MSLQGIYSIDVAPHMLSMYARLFNATLFPLLQLSNNKGLILME